ncbi:DUF973 family protein [Sulfurisphaera javensis]|uniref:DUF973 family protein n=1 Tax=Sulfurisphaera javensis TaxID=2049879 RepID=A0AAT9GVG2_9CREN
MSSQNVELEGLRKLKNGALLSLISQILIILVIIAVYSLSYLFILLGISSASSSSGLPSTLSFATGGIGMSVIIFPLVSLILEILGIVMLRSGYGKLKDLGKDVGMGKLGGTLFLIGLIVTILTPIVVLLLGTLVMNSITTSSITSPNASSISSTENNITLAIIIIFYSAAILGTTLILIGEILLGIGTYRVGDEYNEGTTRVGGTLIAIPIISFIGYMFAYYGLSKIINKLSLTNYPTPIMAQNPVQLIQQPSYGQQLQQTYVNQFSQIGQGVIKSNGYAQLTLYSPTTAVIASAQIQGTSLVSNNINPVFLNPGNNDIVINFGNLPNLIKGNQYIITLYISTNGNLTTINSIAYYQD